MKKKWVIYKITSPSNRIYIGITSNLKKRLSYYKNNNSTGQKKYQPPLTNMDLKIIKLRL